MRLPADGFEIAEAGARDGMTFRAEQFPFQLQIRVAAERPARRDDPVAGDGRIAAFPHDRADRPPRTWRAGDLGDVAVRGDTTAGDSTDRGDDAAREGGRGCERSRGATPPEQVSGQ